ncbi:hypothetical protein ACFLWS_06565 [Chloroflexota bacterium]
MVTAQIRKVIKIDDSLAIILPNEWAKGNVRLGQEMVVVSNSQLRIFAAHSKETQLAHKKEIKGGKDCKNKTTNQSDVSSTARDNYNDCVKKSESSWFVKAYGFFELQIDQKE